MYVMSIYQKILLRIRTKILLSKRTNNIIEIMYNYDMIDILIYYHKKSNFGHRIATYIRS